MEFYENQKVKKLVVIDNQENTWIKFMALYFDVTESEYLRMLIQEDMEHQQELATKYREVIWKEKSN